MKRLAVIPARGGSKRIPSKNIRDFCGTPMMGHILRTARESGLFDVIHVSTDSKVIADTAAQLGFPVDFMRPDDLADDRTGLMPVMKYVTDEYGRRGKIFEQIWLLMACSPLITADDLRGAEKLFVDAGGTCDVLAVSEFPVPVEWAMRRAPSGRFIADQPEMFTMASQTIPKSYFDAGSISVFPQATIDNPRSGGSPEGFVGYVIPKGHAVDIDDEMDWQLAEALFRAKHGEGSRSR